MTKYTLPSQEDTDNRLIEDINQLQEIALGAGAAVCQGCGKPLQGGECVFVYVFRRCPHAAWLAGQTRCADHPLELDTLANDLDAALFLCDEFTQLGLIHASLADTRLVTTPTLLSIFVRTGHLSAANARLLLNAISDARSWGASSYVQRARSLLKEP